MEPSIRFELMTSSLPWMRSTYWAMRAFGCGGRIWTFDLRVMSPTSYQLLHPAVLFLWWRGKDLNLRSVHATDLQSAPFGHLGTPPLIAKLIILQLHSPVNTYFANLSWWFLALTFKVTLFSFFQITLEFSFHPLQRIVNGLNVPV